MKKMTLALLSGGVSSEREVSLNSGNQVFQALDKEKYEVLRYDPKYDLGRLVADARNIDVALIILHGSYGEDGTVQGLLELLNIPYQGSGVLGSAAAMNKIVSKKLYEKEGLLVPLYQVYHNSEVIDPKACCDTIGLPLVVKPAEGGSSIGMSIVWDEKDINVALTHAFSHDRTIVVEKYIKGIELTGAVIGNDNPKPFPLIEIIPGENYTFFDYTAKYTPGATQEICPARIDDNLSEKARQYAVKAHQTLCCKGYSRTDMILNPEGDIYVLETNTIPGMTPTSLFPQAAEAGGYSFSQLLDKLIELGIHEHRRQREHK
jgi:D-alanine-D-alanine ligase